MSNTACGKIDQGVDRGDTVLREVASAGILPLSLLRKNPVASSPQINRNIPSINAQNSNRPFHDLTFLNTASQESPVTNSSMPMIIKSRPSQSTSVANCMAINGINKSKGTAAISRQVFYFL